MGEQRKHPARQSDIARLAGVSQATVSSVITGSGDRYGIAQETRDRVMAAVEELGYVPSVAARQLRGTRNRLVGVHTFEPIFPISQMNFYHEFLVGIEEQAVVDGYNLLLFTATDSTSGQRPLFINGNSQLTVADGTILLGLDRKRSELERLAASGYPFVHIGRRVIDGAEIPFVSPDYQSGVAAAVERLVELGHTKIAYLMDDISFEATAARRDGYRIAMDALGLNAHMVAPSAHLPSTNELDGTTAFLVEGGPQLLWCASYAQAHRLGIPEELSVVVLSDDASAAAPARQWSTLSAPRRELGSEAVRLLVSILDGVDAPSHRYLPCLPLNETSICAARTTLRG